MKLYKNDDFIKFLKYRFQTHQDFYEAANELLAEYGWVPFGTNVNKQPMLKLEVSTQVDDCGDPYWERVIEE